MVIPLNLYFIGDKSYKNNLYSVDMVDANQYLCNFITLNHLYNIMNIKC